METNEYGTKLLGRGAHRNITRTRWGHLGIPGETARGYTANANEYHEKLLGDTEEYHVKLLGGTK